MIELTQQRTSHPGVSVRPLVRDDEDGVRCFYASLSPISRQRRFHSPVARVPESYFARLFANAAPRDLVVVAIDRGEIVGMAELLASTAASLGAAALSEQRVRWSDIAFVVADDHRRQGIARQLVDTLLALAVGVDVVRADVLADNRAALALLRSALPHGHAHVDSGAIVFEAPMHPALELAS